MYQVAIDRGMAITGISVKCLALLALIAFSLAVVSDGYTFHGDCNQSLDEICCNNEFVQRTSGCCSKDSDCLDDESCCNHKYEVDRNNGDNGNSVMIVLGITGGVIFIIWVAFCVRYYLKRRRLRHILIIEENGETTVPIYSNNMGQPPSYQQGYPSPPPPYTPPSTTASGGLSSLQLSYGTI